MQGQPVCQNIFDDLANLSCKLDQMVNFFDDLTNRVCKHGQIIKNARGESETKKENCVLVPLISVYQGARFGVPHTLNSLLIKDFIK